jgi:hypothetical protein
VLLECSMTMSPVATVLLRMLRGSPKLTEAEARRCVPMIVTRIVGSIHNSIQVRCSALACAKACLIVFKPFNIHQSHPLILDNRLMRCLSVPHGNQSLPWWMMSAANNWPKKAFMEVFSPATPASVTDLFRVWP